ncbi:endoglucanase [Methanobrevibacter sp.]|uniref:endoglucanase n=1 Tax=Methanobrevibacter sp. TaxID=66852 RepID=UPI0025EBBC69|nr:endoglucanase [Methanobrevibacter sp.]MBQ2665648.1 endoglucanase [Methanobrevibacter sp.]
MDKANIIISIIIVLCIAAAVAAYGITNSDNPIFSDLSSIGANDNNGNGIGNNTITNQSGPVATDTGNSGTGTGSGGSGSSSGGSSSNSGGSSSNGGSNSNGGGSTNTQLSYSAAKAIATNAILEDGCYAGDGYFSNGYWIFPVYDADGNVVDSIGVNDATGMTERV